MNSSRREFLIQALFGVVAAKSKLAFATYSNNTDKLIPLLLRKATNIKLELDTLKKVQSKITSSAKDQTQEFQNEISKLTDNTIYIVSPGTYKIRNLIFPNLKNVIFIFEKVIFQLTENTSPLDHEMIRFNSLVNSIVYDLNTDGNRDNAIDTNINDYHWYGRCLNWRLGDNSESVYFLNTTMTNSLYCGSQWGKNINNVIMDTITFNNIGEHVFYISGNGGGNSNNIKFINIKGGSLGINPRNKIKKHETFFVKSSQTIGPNNNFSIENADFSPSQKASYANIIVCTGDLTSLNLKNITLNGNVDAVIYPYNQSSYVKMDNIIVTSENSRTRLIYSYVKNVKTTEWIASNIDLSKSIANQQYMQIFTEIKSSSFNKIYLSEMNNKNPSKSNHQTTFKNVKFSNPIQGSEISNRINFNDCIYNVSKNKFNINKTSQNNQELFSKFSKKIIVKQNESNSVTLIPQ